MHILGSPSSRDVKFMGAFFKKVYDMKLHKMKLHGIDFYDNKLHDVTPFDEKPYEMKIDTMTFWISFLQNETLWCETSMTWNSII